MVYFVEIDGNSEKSGGSEAMKMLEEKIRHLQKMLDEKSKMLDALSNHARFLEYK